MAKVIAFLLFLCIQFTRQEEVAAVEKSTEELPEQATLETYPLDIKVDEKDTIHEHVKSSEKKEIPKKCKEAWKTDKAELQREYNKISESIEKWISKTQPKNSNYKWLRIIEKGTDAKCANYYYDENFKGFGKYSNTKQLWEDYIQITLDIEEWIMKVDYSMSPYKWLKILEEGSYENQIIPRCPAEVDSIYDYYDKDYNGAELRPSYDDYSQLDDYTQVTLDIEEWLTYAQPRSSLYKWLKVLEEGSVVKGAIPKCSKKVESLYDYYRPNNQISSEKNQEQLMKAYDYYSKGIEKWIKKNNPKMADFKWLEIIQEETKAQCPDNFIYDANPLGLIDYDYYYDIETTAYLDDNPQYGAKLSSYNKPKPQFKRFTSV